MSKVRLNHATGEPPSPPSPAWIDALATIGEQFEQEWQRFPELFHTVTFATRDQLGRFKAIPHVRLASGEQGVFVGLEDRPVSGVSECFGSCQGGPVFVSRGSFFGCDDDPRTIDRAVAAFRRVAARASACLSEVEVQPILAAPYLELEAFHGLASDWLLALYALAWTSGPELRLKADRRAYVADGPHINWLDLERLLRPPGPSNEEVERALSEKSLGGRTWRDEGVGFPPPWFTAFLDPDVFRASKQAIDHIIRNSTINQDKPQADEGWLTVTQAHEVYAIPTATISRLASDGKLRSNGKTGPERRIDPASLAAFKLAQAKDERIKKLQKHLK